MNNTVRTTIRIRKDLFDQSRLLAFSQGTSLQQVINDMLAKGFSYISDVGNRKRTMAEIDKFRNSMRGKKDEKLLQRARGKYVCHIREYPLK